MKDFSQRIAALSPAQQALLKLRWQQKQNITAETTIYSTIPKRQPSAELSLPVSFAQQRMWFQDQFGAKSAASNNISIALKITGAIQTTALEKSIKTILLRHEILRTNLQTVNGELIQIISPEITWKLGLIDLRHLSISAQENQVQELAIKQACQPFDLENELLLRTAWLQLQETEHILLLTLHHIAVDAWSIGIFFRELSALYGAFSTGKSSPLPELPIQYADFAIWQRQYFQDNLLDKAINYWQQQLQNAPSLLQLPTDRPRPPVQSFTGKTLSFILPKALTNSLKQLSQQAETTLFTTLLAGLQTLLFRYTGQEDILVGSPIANRHHSEIENLIGCFINTLVLRTNLSGNPSFWQLLHRVKGIALEAFNYQNLPFEKLVDKLQLPRNLSHPPLFQVMLVLQNSFSIENIELPGLEVSHARIDNYTSQFDLTFHLVESERGLIGKLEYNTDIFDESTVLRILGHWQTLLTEIAINPSQSLLAIPLLTEAEKRQLLIWNQTETNYAQNASIHQLFEAQVEKTPDAVAVVIGAEQISYRELNQRANQLARYLQKLGVQTEVLVGICVERSIAMVVGILGILKAGGAYLALDPNYPQQRLTLILEDADLSIILTQNSLQTRLPEFTASLVCLDTDWEKIALENSENLSLSILPENLVYAIYTSGSTGKPKGVMIQHQSLVNYTQSAIQEYRISASDRILQFASISFDAAAEEIFPCLTQGATLVLRTEQMLSSMAVFLQKCHHWQVTILDLPTAFWHQLVAEIVAMDLTLPDSLRLVILGGEKALFDSFILWQQRVNSSVRLVNSYGPTEATIVTTTVDLDSSIFGQDLPIGKPVNNVKTYILDALLNPVPIGIPGELYIGGVGVTRGYLNRPDLTAQVLIPDSFSQVAGARLYKTGDRVRYRPDGNIEFLGRIDNQVKIRGFRIELEEIAALLIQHPEVQASIVINSPDSAGENRLIAYVVPASGSTPKNNQLRHFLEKKLPNYMLPAAFVCLESLPLNTNGKVDRQALPTPENFRPELASNFLAPRNSIEAEIAKIFARVLKLEQVGIEDDFFELGGHSLLATKLMAQLLKAFPVELSIVDLFQSPTVAELGAKIENLQMTATAATLSDLTLKMCHLERTSAMPIPLSFSQQSMWENHHVSSSGETLNSSIILRVKKSLLSTVVEQSFNELVRRHEILRTVFRIIDGQPMQFVLPELLLSLNYIDLRSLSPERRESEALNWGIKIAQLSFDLASAPLIRTALLQLDSQEYWLLITMHHIITDGWSFGLLLQELDTLIEAFAHNLPSPLPEVTLQYLDFALWQQRVYNEEKIAKQLEYWQHQLVDLASPSLPAQSLSTRQASHYFSYLPESLVSSIESLSRSLGVTSFVVLLAALKLALAAWSGERDIWIVTTVGNRTVPETEQMIGCFINDVILRSQLISAQTGTNFIKQLQGTVKEAIAHKEVPLELVIAQTKQLRPCNFMASITVTSSTERVEQVPGWELVEVQSQPQQWEDVPSELFVDDIPLEFYLEIGQKIQIVVNYSLEKFTVQMLDKLLANYQKILIELATQPEKQLLELIASL